MKLRLTFALFFFLACASAAFAQRAQDHWVGTWAASPMLRVMPAQAAAQPAQGGGRGNGAAPAKPPLNRFSDQTIRQVVRTSIGGARVRVELSNVFGLTALQIGAAHLALADNGGAIVEGTDHALAVNGQRTFAIPAGASLLTDPIDMTVAPLTEMAVSLYLPAETGPATLHASAYHTTYVSKSGDETGQASIAEAITSTSYFFLSAIHVAAADASAVVTFGDSITDGTASTINANRAWPSVLADRLAADASTRNIAVLNEGIGGNRLLRDGTGPSALARFDRDVIAQPGVKWVTVLEGINDIGSGAGPNATPATALASADELIAVLRQMIARAHEHGIKIAGCTLTPYMGTAYSSERGETMRAALNDWIRQSAEFDVVIDFDAATRDAGAPTKMKAEYDSGDHLHPGDAGYKAMAGAIPLEIFRN